MSRFPRLNRVIPISAGIGAAIAAREAIARAREADLAGNVALITGGSRGLGLAIARELAGEGCKIAICAREADELDRATSDLQAMGAEVLAITCDVTNQEEVDRTVARTIEHFGRIDLLFTVAGIIEVAPVDDLTVEDFRHAMDVMFWGTLYPILAVRPHMKERGSGRIATITSIGGKIAVPHLLPYTAAKFAAVGLSEGLSAELASEGITVTTIIPGLMRTGSHLNARFKGNEEQQEGDYTWFSLGATMPLSARADRAARIIVRAVKRGESERVFTAPFALASHFAGMAPATTTRIARMVDRLLPESAKPGGPVTIERGMEIDRRIDSKVLDAATALGDEAAADFNQKPGPIHTEDA